MTVHDYDTYILSYIAYVASVPTRHSLPNNRIIAMFGSLSDGNCSLPVPSDHRGGICNGTSVLNDGIIPALNVGDDSESLWAAQLLTMKRGSNGPIVLSFEVENQFYDCVELAVFNCPEKNMNASGFSIYQDSSFRPERQEASLGDNIIANHSLSNSSCDYLLRFYVSFMSEVKSSYFNIRFPNYTIIENISYVFVGEVSFLTGAHDCEKWPPELIETTKYLLNSKCMLDSNAVA